MWLPIVRPLIVLPSVIHCNNHNLVRSSFRVSTSISKVLPNFELIEILKNDWSNFRGATEVIQFKITSAVKKYR